VRFLLATLICAAGLAAISVTASSTPSIALTCPKVGPHQGGTSGDYEAAFGRRLDIQKANAFLARVHRKGFGCAKIENEGGTHEICVNGLVRESAAERIVRRAHRRGLRAAYVSRS